MSSALDSALQSRNKPLPEIEISADLGMVERRTNNNVVHTSGYVGMMMHSPEAIAAANATLPSTSDDSSFINSLMREIDQNDPTLYKQLAYFAQLNNMTGFMYSYRNYRNEDVDIVFDTGMLLTRDRVLVDSLRYDINRTGGIGHVIKEISASVYLTMQDSAERYKSLMASSGAIGSNAIDAHAMARDAAAKQQNEEIAALRAQVSSLTKLVQSSPELAAKAANPTPTERAAITVTAIPAEEKAPAATPVTPVTPVTPTASSGIFGSK